MGNCIFCKIADRSLPAKIIFEDKDVVAFHDINPQAPVHILIIPKKHVAKIADLDDSDQELVGKLILVARNQARLLNLERDGYRLVFNNGRFGGQQVYHIHLHLLGGRPFRWPPG